LSTFFKALENDLTIIPVINKIDLPNINVNNVIESIVKTFGFNDSDIIRTSGKTGEGVTTLLNAIIEHISPPTIPNNQTKALIFDSFYHEYKGVVALIKVVSGEIKNTDEIYTMGSKIENSPVEIGYLKPDLTPTKTLKGGEVGYIATGIKNIKAIHVGDTIILNNDSHNKDIEQLPGYKPPKPMVYASLYPLEADQFEDFKDALEKLALNDAALVYQRESSKALGSGFLCGFLGLLHMEITQERLNREFGIDLITTTPSVEYLVELNTKNYSKIENLNFANIDSEGILHIHSSTEFPDPIFISSISEPIVNLEIITPENYIGPIMDLSQSHRGIYKSMEYLSNEVINTSKQVMIKYEIPVAEIIINFFDQLKSISQGYASMDYTFLEYRHSDVRKVNILINFEVVEALSFMSHTSNAEYKGRNLAAKLATLIPRQQIPIPIQAALGLKVFARETVKAYRKDVLAKMSGGDVTRKNKLLDIQKKGKKKAKEKLVGKIRIPQDVFMQALKLD
jgi:GTP-binding protein LepA